MIAVLDLRSVAHTHVPFNTALIGILLSARGKWRGYNRAVVEHILPTIAPIMDESGYRV